MRGKDIKFDFPDKKDSEVLLEQDIRDRLLGANNYKTTKSLIMLHAYLHKEQQELLPNDFQIEHIFLKKWQNANYNGWSQRDAKEYLEKFGNKVVIEKKINIKAGNGYFGQKKKKYQKSNIQEVLDLSKLSQDDWHKVDIEAREAEFCDCIYQFFSDNLSGKPKN